LSERLGITLFIKDETGLPTGSWKDREAFVFFDRLRRHGIADIVLFSAGNTGAALARAAGILRWSRLHLVVPDSSRERIRSLPHFHNDHVTIVFHDGSNDECIECAREYANRHGFTREGGFTNYVRREGLKTLGLEVIHQACDLGVSFDWSVQPVAGGIGVYSFRKAHIDSGLAASQPRILGVQADVYTDVNALVQSGQWAQAQALADARLKTAPTDPQMRLLQSHIQTGLGQTQAAMDTLRALTQSFPELPEPHNNLAALLVR
jgi:threonine synthase